MIDKIWDHRPLFIVDSPIVALILSLAIPRDCHFFIVLELKVGIDDQLPNFKATMLAILSEHTYTVFDQIFVPSPYFISGRNRCQKVRNLILFSREVRSLFRVNDFNLLVGPATSSIFLCNPQIQRFVIDHGVGDYLKRKCQAGIFPLLAHCGKYLLFRLFKYPYAPLVDNHSLGFSLTAFKASNCTHVALSDYCYPKAFDAVFKNLKASIDGYTKLTLVLPSAIAHSEDGFDRDTRPFDKINIDMILRSCNKDELILLKFHPTAFSSSIPVTLGDSLRAYGFHSLNIDDLLPGDYQGHLPVEIIAIALGIKKIVAEASAALWNLASIDNVEVIADPVVFDGQFNRKFCSHSFCERMNLISKYEVKILSR